MLCGNSILTDLASSFYLFISFFRFLLFISPLPVQHLLYSYKDPPENFSKTLDKPFAVCYNNEAVIQRQQVPGDRLKWGSILCLPRKKRNSYSNIAIFCPSSFPMEGLFVCKGFSGHKHCFGGETICLVRKFCCKNSRP